MILYQSLRCLAASEDCNDIAVVVYHDQVQVRYLNNKVY